MQIARLRKVLRTASWLVLPPLIGAVAAYILVTTGNFSISVFGDEPPGASSPLSSGATVPEFSAEETASIMAAEFPAYGVGQEFRGLPLVHTRAVKVTPPEGVRDMPTNAVHYIYGGCTPPPGEGLEGGTCVAPLEIVSGPYCSRRPEFIPAALKGGDEFVVRGARGQWTGDPSQGDLRLYARDVTISIYASDRDMALAAANELRSMTPGRGVEDVSQDLGVPDEDACYR